MVCIICWWHWHKVAFDGGYDPCNNATFFLGQDSKRKKREVSEPCDPGFVPDTENGYCYMGYQPGLLSVSNGKDFCQSFSADLLTFENDAQISGVLQLISSGNFLNIKTILNLFFIIIPNILEYMLQSFLNISELMTSYLH